MSGAAMLDVRKPIGALFAALGFLLTSYGFATMGAPGSRPTGVPIVPIWGVVLLVFGLGMLWISRRPAAPRP